MQAQIKLGRAFGVQLRLHYSWLIIALLVMLSLAGQFHSTNPQWGEGTIWATAISAERPKYIEAFFSNTDWKTVDKRLQKSTGAAG